jgi:phosphatidylserine/phosphatidylglycerophosphate/cardiolipin synthase-like enzyme
MIVDGETVITGSFNFTKAAEERNAEKSCGIPRPCDCDRVSSELE